MSFIVRLLGNKYVIIAVILAVLATYCGYINHQYSKYRSKAEYWEQTSKAQSYQIEQLTSDINLLHKQLNEYISSAKAMEIQLNTTQEKLEMLRKARELENGKVIIIKHKVENAKTIKEVNKLIEEILQ